MKPYYEDSAVIDPFAAPARRPAQPKTLAENAYALKGNLNTAKSEPKGCNKRFYNLKTKPQNNPKPKKNKNGKGSPRKTESVSIGAEQEKLLATFPKGHATRLRGLYIRWMGAKSDLRESDKRELLDSGLVQINGASNELKYVTLSQFAKTNGVSRHDVQNALNLQGMPGRLANGLLDFVVAKEWWVRRKTIGPSGGNGGILEKAATAKAEREIDQARITKAEADKQEREVSEKWIEVEAVRIFMEGRGLKDCQDVDALLEDKTGLRSIVIAILLEAIPTLTDGLRATIEQQLIERFRKANDELKGRFLKRAGETIKRNT